MIIECNTCDSKVDAEVICINEEYDPEIGEVYRYLLMKCPACGSTLLAGQDHYQTSPETSEWGNATRMWPDPDGYLHRSIPFEARTSLEEARTCYKAKAFSACAVMCGRAIEAICVEHTNEKTLHKGLTALSEAGIIDGRLLEWGDSLRHERNLGAHATGAKTTRDDARDVLDFATAICEYVYVLTEKYNEYKERKSQLEKDSTK